MAIDKVAMECGGKRSATPLWLRVALLLHQQITALRESGVALRLLPHSTSVAPGHLGDFVNGPVFRARGGSPGKSSGAFPSNAPLEETC